MKLCVFLAVLVLVKVAESHVSVEHIPEDVLGTLKEKYDHLSGEARDLLARAKPQLEEVAGQVVTHGSAILGEVMDTVRGFFRSQSGERPVEGTDLVLKYEADRCSFDFKFSTFRPRRSCDASVWDPVTDTRAECNENTQTEAVQCAYAKVIVDLNRMAGFAPTEP